MSGSMQWRPTRSGRVSEVRFHNSDIVKCFGCVYYKNFDGSLMCCTYCLETGHPREVMPKDCYTHEGTPYKASWDKRDKKEDKDD